MERKEWTKDDIKFLEDKYENPNLKLKWIYSQLGRTKKSVCHKASRIGLHRPRANIDKKKRDKMSDSDRIIKEKAYYQKNKGRIRDRKRNTRRNLKAELVEMLGGGCSVCDEKRLPCIDFHHKNGDKEIIKEFGYVGQALSNENRTKSIEEAKKCILLCGNCHRVEHYKEDIV